MITKTCTSCGEVKGTAEFGKKESCKDGLHYYCLECARASTRAGNRKYRATPEGRAKHNAANTRRHKERLKTDSWYRLKWQLADRTNRLMHQLTRGSYCEVSCINLFGASQKEVLAKLTQQLNEKGLSWTDYQKTWSLDHIQPVALAQSDIELKAMFKLCNVQPLTLEEHAVKSIVDTARVRMLSQV